MPNLLSERLAGTRSPAAHCEIQECLVLQYHRVALLSHDPLRLAVQPCNFERQMEYLATSFNVISMDELRQHIETVTPFRAGTVGVTGATSPYELCRLRVRDWNPFTFYRCLKTFLG